MAITQKRKTLLVMTSATGAGHDTHARATREWCERIYGSAVEVHIEHVLEDSHPLCRTGVEFYNQIQRGVPWFHHVYYHLLELPGFFDTTTVWPGAGYFERLLQRIRPDAILSTHDCLNRGYFEVARNVLGENVRCATYCTEFEGGYGFSRNWVNPRADLLLVRTEEVREAGRSLGSAKERIQLAGHWAPCDFYGAGLSDGDRANFLEEELGLGRDRFTVLLSTGGAGAQNHAALLRELRIFGSKIQVVALCGRDEGSRVWLENWVGREVDFPVRVLPFTQKMPQLLASCSVVVARAGATTAGEALLRGCPVVFNAVGGIMPQEMPTWRYFRQRGLGGIFFRPRGLGEIMGRWLEDPAGYVRQRALMAAHRDPVTPVEGLRALLD